MNVKFPEDFVFSDAPEWRLGARADLPERAAAALARMAAGGARELAIAAGEARTLIESPATEARAAFANVKLVAHEGAKLDFVFVNDLAEEAFNFNFIELEAHARAKVCVTLLNVGRAAYTRQVLQATFKGEGACVELRSLSLARGAQEIDQRTFQLHEAPGAKSDLLFKNVLDGNARTVFSGMIRVFPGAQKTDAYQQNRNLLLSDAAMAHTLPGLEIQADDVRCTHGATCGGLEDEALFYLRARGVGEAEARGLLAEGFCAEILAGLPEEARSKMPESLAQLFA